MGQKRQSDAAAGAGNPGLVVRSLDRFLDLLFNLERAAADGREVVRTGEIDRDGHTVKFEVAYTVRELASARDGRRRRQALRRAAVVRRPDRSCSYRNAVLPTRLSKPAGASR